ncbi:MAG: tRNA (5-methylaminomethyl-2-thiouridine)(34)-methyltransferase MnmD [Bacteroidota bacterium]
MNRIVQTKDNSCTLYSDTFKEHYHSTNGALTESSHIFIKNGLYAVNKQKINILEIGFGTGLNAVLTHLEANRRGINVMYHGIDLYPPEKAELKAYYESFDEPVCSAGVAMMQNPWNQTHNCGDHFSLKKIKADFTGFDFTAKYDIIYFDAFSPEVQPEAWDYKMFAKMYQHMKPSGILVTFSVKGKVKNALRKTGFEIEILPGPPGKRHILRAKA